MRYEAVIFDLFGTLVPNANGEYCHRLSQAGILSKLSGGQEREFTRLWESRDVRRMRTINLLDTTEAAIRFVCDQFGIEPTDIDLAQAIDLHREYLRHALKASDETLQALAQIRQAGRKIALMADSTSETARLWARSEMAGYFDEAMFSCQTGLATPHPRFYELVSERLGTRRGDCLYVTAVGGKSLLGARQAGMGAALLASEVDNAPTGRANWNEPTIASLSEVMPLLAGAAASVA